MKVLHLINGLGPGGAERSLVELLPVFQDAGIDSVIVLLKERSEGFATEAGTFGCRTFRVRGKSLPIWIPAVRRLLYEERPDLIHTSLLEASLVGRLASIGTGIPVLTSLVNTPYEKIRLRDPALNQLGFRAVRHLDALTARFLTTHFHAITKAVKDSYQHALGISPERISVVERGRERSRIGTVSESRRIRVRERLGVQPERTIILNVGRQEFQKGQLYLVEAMAELVKELPDHLLLIAGRPGSQSTVLKETIFKLGLTEHVILLGHRDDVTDIMAASDVFVFPSLYEGLGGTLIESMAIGLPIVASDIPVLREVLGEAAVFARPASPESIAHEVRNVLQDPARRNSLITAGKQRFDLLFDISRTGPRMIQLYKEVAKL